MREFLRQYEVRPLPARHSVLNVLLDAYQQWAGHREAPRIAILDWREVPSYSEFVLFADYFKSQGFECIIADPREVEYRDGRLMAGDFHITLIYKRVLINELIERSVGWIIPWYERCWMARSVWLTRSAAKFCIKKRAWPSSAMSATPPSSMPKSERPSRPIFPGRAASRNGIPSSTAR